MSCYQVLALNNNTGDLQITQGNTVNLVQVIKNFSIKTPVVDFKLDGNGNLDLYYTDANGNIQLKTVALPASGNNNTAISVASTSSISASIQSGVITSNVNLSQSLGNAISLNPDGLFVPVADTTVSVASSSSILLSNSAGTISATAIISPQGGNALTATDGGLYVPPNTLTPTQIWSFLSATSPVQFNQSNGVISSLQAAASVAGYLSSTDWNTFNNKVSSVASIGSASSTPVYKNEVAGVANIRPIAAGNAGIAITLVGDDILVSTTATVPFVSAGGSQIISTTSSTSTTLSGVSSTSFGFISSNQWLQLAGPNVATFSDTSQLVPTVSNLIPGTYTFRLFATASTGLTGSSIATVIVNNGSITLDTIYIGVQSSSTPPNATQVQAGTSSMQNGAANVTADWTALSSSGPVFCWFAIPNLGGTYFKTKYYGSSINHGNIGGSTDLFGSYTYVTIGSIVYAVGFTNYLTQFLDVILLEA